MSLSAVLDTVIGVSFVFFLLSLASSAVAEWLATMFKKRAKYLLRGLRSMLDGPPAPPVTAAATDRKITRPGIRDLLAAQQHERTMHTDALGVLAQAASQPMGSVSAASESQTSTDVPGSPALTRFLSHPLVAAQAQTRANGGATRAPSYLSAKTFATVVLDLFVADAPAKSPDPKADASAKSPHATLRERIAETHDVPEPLKTVLSALAKQADQDIGTFGTAVAEWYDAQMDRVSGAYKRWVKRWIIVIAAVFVLTIHVDAIALGTTLWHDPGVRQATVALASPSACDAKKPVTGKPQPTEQEYLTCLSSEADALAGAGLPIGAPAGCRFTHPTACILPDRDTSYNFSGFLAVLAGLGLSVLAASFGAPFWFQVLTRAGSLRNTGTKPASAGRSGS